LVSVVFHYLLLLMGTPNKSKISSDQTRIQFGVGIYHLSFYANTPFGLWSKVTAFWHKEQTITSLRTCTFSHFGALVKMHYIKYAQIGTRPTGVHLNIRAGPNLCSPTLDCTANLQLLKRQRTVGSLMRMHFYGDCILWIGDNIWIKIRNANPLNWQKGFL